MPGLTQKENLYEKLEDVMKHAYADVHAIYDPDGSDPYGDCYSAAVDLYQPGMTFRVYFKENADGLRVEHAERWHFG